MKTHGRLNKKLLTGIAFLWALAGVGSGLAKTSASEFLRTAQAVAARTATCAADADDLASEVALRFLKSTRKSSASGSTKAATSPTSLGYIYRSIRNVQSEWLRKLKRTESVPRLEENEDTEFLGLSTPIPDPSRAAEFAELFSSLSDAERGVLELLTQGMSEREIAQATGKTRYHVHGVIEGLRSRAQHFIS